MWARSLWNKSGRPSPCSDEINMGSYGSPVTGSLAVVIWGNLRKNSARISPSKPSSDLLAKYKIGGTFWLNSTLSSSASFYCTGSFFLLFRFKISFKPGICPGCSFSILGMFSPWTYFMRSKTTSVNLSFSSGTFYFKDFDFGILSSFCVSHL